MYKKILLGVLVLFILIQFIKPEQNLSGDDTYHISTKYIVPNDVQNILKVACNDCHTNQSEYPWYAKIQPVAWFMNHNITDGKRHYNLSTFAKLPIAVQNHKFEETIEQVEKHEMPDKSYTYFGLHPQAKLSDAQRQILISWARAQMDTLKTKYPEDSLIMKKRRG
jgi:Haem-binding domain